MNISVGIPNYNGLSGLRQLLPQITELDFKHIYLLDDHSSDGSVEFARIFPQVTVICGRKNLGAGANRNRILKQSTAPIIWFVDADMILKTRNKQSFEKIIKTFQSHKDVSVIGGQIFSKNAEPMFWNYGYEMHPERDGVIPVLEKLFFKFSDNKEVADYIRSIARHYYFNLEMKVGASKKREVDWIAEGNFFIRAALFKKMQGFDTKLRYHETQDLCRRIREERKKILFTPDVKTLHTELDVRGPKRAGEIQAAAAYFYKKHWALPKEAFETLAQDHADLLEKLKKI